MELENTETRFTILRTQFFDRQNTHATLHVDEVRRETERCITTFYHVIQTQNNEQHVYHENTYHGAIRMYTTLMTVMLLEEYPCVSKKN